MSEAGAMLAIELIVVVPSDDTRKSPRLVCKSTLLPNLERRCARRKQVVVLAPAPVTSTTGTGKRTSSPTAW